MNDCIKWLVTLLTLLISLGATCDVYQRGKAVANEENRQAIALDTHEGKGALKGLINPAQFDYAQILAELGYSDYQLTRVLTNRYKKDHQLHLYFKGLSGVLNVSDLNTFQAYITRIIGRLGFKSETCDQQTPYGERFNNSLRIYV